MKFEITPIQLSEGQTISSLYHSPFDLGLFYILSLAKTGLKIRVIIDDIDNLGVERGAESVMKYEYTQKYFLSKTERTNVRQLSFILPKHFFANLSLPELKELDSRTGIQALKDYVQYKDTTEHWIRDITKQFGSFSLTGPDKAFGFSKIDTSFIFSILEAKEHIKYIIENNFPLYKEKGFIFIDWLIKENEIAGESISDYFVFLLEKILERFLLKNIVKIERMSGQEFQLKNIETFNKFLNNKEFQAVYQNALIIDGKKKTDAIPFYAIAKKDGSRLLDPFLAINDPLNYILAPKVLMLNSLDNLILPYVAIAKQNVRAREIIYQSGFVKSNQIFCSDDWISKVSALISEVTPTSIEKDIYKFDKNSLDRVLMKLYQLSQEFRLNGDLGTAFTGWLASSTLNSLTHFKYPLLFLCLLQEKAFTEEMPKFFSFRSD